MAEEIILRIGFEQLPVIIGAFLLAAGSAIIISTGNTFLMVTSTNVTRDIFQAFFFKDASSQQIVWIQRATIIGIGVLAYLMMSQFETILEARYANCGRRVNRIGHDHRSWHRRAKRGIS